MHPIELAAVAFALSLDAFAVAVASGVVIQEKKVAHAIRLALFFGGFQALMPLIGWLAGHGLSRFISGCDHWIAFALLAAVGLKMIYEAFKLEPEEKRDRSFGVPILLVLAIATSLDALAVGLSLALTDIAIMTPVIVIGAVTFTLSLIGVWIGDRFGHLFESKIEIVGGLILIAIGVKILLGHL